MADADFKYPDIDHIGKTYTFLILWLVLLSMFPIISFHLFLMSYMFFNPLTWNSACTITTIEERRDLILFYLLLLLVYIRILNTKPKKSWLLVHLLFKVVMSCQLQASGGYQSFLLHLICIMVQFQTLPHVPLPYWLNVYISAPSACEKLQSHITPSGACLLHDCSSFLGYCC